MHVDEGTPAERRLVEAVRRYLPDYRLGRSEPDRKRIFLRVVVMPCLIIGTAWVISHFALSSGNTWVSVSVYPFYAAVALTRRFAGGHACLTAIALTAILLAAAGGSRDFSHLFWLTGVTAAMIAVAFSMDIPPLRFYGGGGRQSRRKMASITGRASSREIVWPEFSNSARAS